MSNGRGSAMQSTVLVDFAKRYSDLEQENRQLKETLQKERDELAALKLSTRQDRRSTMQNDDMRQFAEKSIEFCEQMRLFATHILHVRSASPVSSEIKQEIIPEPAVIEPEGTPVTSQAPAPVDVEGKDTTNPSPDQHRLILGLRTVLSENSCRISLQSLPKVYSRRFNRDLEIAPDMTLEETLRALPKDLFRVESGSLILDKIRISKRRRSPSADMRNRDHSPRRSHRNGPVSNISPSRNADRARPARAGYRFARNSEGVLVCIYFNSSRGCPNKPCRFAHICGRCGRSSHGVKDCPERMSESEV